MKKDIILIALGIGFLMFLFKWAEKPDQPLDAFKYQVVSCLGIYYAMHRHYKRIFEQDAKPSIRFGDSFLFGLKLCLIASVFAVLLYLALPDSSSLVTEISKPMRSLDLLVSALVMGGIIAFIGSIIITRRYS